MPEALGLTRKVLKALRVLTWVYGGAILALLLASYLEPEWFFRAIGVQESPHAQTVGSALRAMAMLGIATVPLNVAILDRLLAIVNSVRVGDPFVVENAHRLTAIAWLVVALEVIHLLIGISIRVIENTGQPIDMDWKFSLAPYIAVLLLFVLAKVFEHGARMRADLEGTV
jgi:hypothetical protein